MSYTKCEHGVVIDARKCSDCIVAEIETLFVEVERLRKIEEAAHTFKDGDDEDATFNWEALCDALDQSQ